MVLIKLPMPIFFTVLSVFPSLISLLYVSQEIDVFGSKGVSYDNLYRFIDFQNVKWREVLI